MQLKPDFHLKVLNNLSKIFHINLAKVTQLFKRIQELK